MTNRYRLVSSADALKRTQDMIELHPKKVIFISAEGTETESDYFNHLYASLVEKHGKTLPFILVVLEHERDTDSDPRHVLGLIEECSRIRNDNLIFSSELGNLGEKFSEERVIKFFKEPESFDVEERTDFYDTLVKIGIDVDYYQKLRSEGGGDNDDIFAIVIDRDQGCHSLAMLKDVKSKCQNRGFLYCLTNPCFEFWLLLHFVDVARVLNEEQKVQCLANDHVSNNHTYVSKLLSENVHHRKSIPKQTFDDKYFPHIKDALRHLQSLAIDENDVLLALGSSLPVLFNEIGFLTIKN